MKRELAEHELTEVGPKRSGTAGRRTRSVTVNVSESPLAWLHSRGHVDDRQFDAGERLRLDYERAQLSPSITMSWNPVRADGGGRGELTPSERQLAAKDRFDGAMAEAGSGLKDVLWRVVCAGAAMSEAEKELGWPARSGKLVLKLALDRVADYYRIR